MNWPPCDPAERPEGASIVNSQPVMDMNQNFKQDK